jgi:hypothetical protein
MVAGALIASPTVSYEVFDEVGNVVQGPTTINPPAASQTTIALLLSSTVNTLGMIPDPTIVTGPPIPAPRGLRQIVTTFVSTDGTFVDTQYYVLNAADPLVRMVNSFITTAETHLTRYELLNMDGWDQSTEDAQLAALATAYEHMLQLRYRFPIGENFQSRIVDFYGMSVDNVFGRIFMVLADIAYYTDIDFQGWPGQFQNALKRAQMAEANFLLNGDPIIDKRNSGVIAEAIGEAKMNFRTVPDVVTPVCKDALQHLRGFLNSSIIIGRG